MPRNPLGELFCSAIHRDSGRHDQLHVRVFLGQGFEQNAQDLSGKASNLIEDLAVFQTRDARERGFTQGVVGLGATPVTAPR
jgi:hypothetical protein